MIKKLGLMYFFVFGTLLQAMEGAGSHSISQKFGHFERLAQLIEQGKFDYYLEIKNKMIRIEKSKLNLDVIDNKQDVMKISQRVSALVIEEIAREAAVAQEREKKAAQVAKDEASFGNGFKKGFLDTTNKTSKK